MKISPELLDKVKGFIDDSKHTLSNSLGIEFITISSDKLVARMPVDERTKQPLGLLHGGASVALAETLASVGGWMQIDAEKEIVVGSEINANHLRPVTSGFVTGTASPIHIGRKTQVWHIEIRSEDSKLVCISRCTLVVLPRAEFN